MESRTLAVFDSCLWFIRVGVAVTLIVSTMSHAGDVNPQIAQISQAQLTNNSKMSVQLVRRLPDRKGRKLSISPNFACTLAAN